jgi:hypothetical protein
MPGQATKTATERAREKAAIREACDAYLQATRGQPEARYREVEPWAWTQLKLELAKLGVTL